jgi:hypothetical protein
MDNISTAGLCIEAQVIAGHMYTLPWHILRDTFLPVLMLIQVERY